MADRAAEARLTTALVEGIFETPLWTSFLDQLRDLTAADHAILMFQAPGRPYHEALLLLSGSTPDAVLQFYRDHFYPDGPPLPVVAEGEPHSLADLLDGAAYSHESDFYRDLVKGHGVDSVLQVRVQEATGVDAWLTLTRRGKGFAARDTALLRSIAPILRGVLRQYVAMERERYAASLTAEAVRRLQFGWLMLDSAGRVLDSDAQGAHVLSDSGVLSRNSSGRLTAKPIKLDREITAALNSFAGNPHGRPRAITLSRKPWLDMLLVPARSKSISTKAAPAAIAYVHGDSWRSSDRCEQLAELFALSPSESRLALALSRGMNIAEAASAFGLTIETARNYSKTIYAKTGARGMPDLVRIVMRSVLAISPEAHDPT